MASLAVMKGCFSCVVLGLLGSTAYFQASAVTRLVACALGDAPRAAPSATTPAARPPPQTTAAGLLARNVFDSVTGPLLSPTAPCTEDELFDPLSAPSCNGMFLYIVSESSDKRWSVATLRGAGESRPRLRRVGDEIASQRVEYIGYNPRQKAPAVWLSSGRALCQTVLFAGKSPEPARPAAEQPSSLPAAPPERLRIVPELEAGRLIGVRLFGIQPQGAFATIGLKNGDRLEAINGLAMDSPEHALQLYASMRTTSDFNLRIARGREGRSRSITLHLK